MLFLESEREEKSFWQSSFQVCVFCLETAGAQIQFISVLPNLPQKIHFYSSSYFSREPKMKLRKKAIFKQDYKKLPKKKYKHYVKHLKEQLLS